MEFSTEMLGFEGAKENSLGYLAHLTLVQKLIRN